TVRETHPVDGQVNHAPVVDEATAEIPGLRAFGVDGRRRLREVGRRQYVWLVVHCWNGRETRSGPAVPVAGPPPGPRSRNSRVSSSPSMILVNHDRAEPQVLEAGSDAFGVADDDDGEPVEAEVLPRHAVHVLGRDFGDPLAVLLEVVVRQV